MDSVDHVPHYDIRWLRPAYSTALLDLPTAPVSQGATDAWRAFSEEESAACEEAWQRLPKDEQHNTGEGLVIGPDDLGEQADMVGVQIYKDKLYEVDVRVMQLKPVYWRLTGNPIPVMRAHWMFDETHPVPEPLSSQLEKAYRRTKPWLATYAEELRAALSAGTTDAHDKLKRELPGNDQGQSVVFQDGVSGRIVSDNLAFRVQQSLYSSFMNTNHPVAFPGATPVYRGFDAAELAAAGSKDKAKTDSRSGTPTHNRSASSSSSKKGKDSTSKKSTEERELVETDVPTKTGEEGDGDGGDVTDLVFIVHGIGQSLATQYEGLNFVYASNLFRQVCRKQSASPAISSIMRNRRIQFLPVMWRSNFALTVDDEHLRAEEGLDNHFNIEDITLKESIPFVRELANNVILDVPYFMSGHRESMIKSVCEEANYVYRKWCKRNPGFDQRGRVHIIAHSLGSPLVTHVLSNQPTHVKPLSELSEGEVDSSKGFLFNTSALFMAGSPLAMFMLLDQRQLIARKGRQRTKDSPHDEALNRNDLFGCMSIDALYNVFYPSDPIAYRLNPCVDSHRAQKLPPLAITSINASFFGRLSQLLGLPALPSMPVMPSMPAMPTLPTFKLPFMTSRSPSRPRTPDNKQVEDKEKEKKRKEEEEKAARERAEADALAVDPRETRARRRFEALNPHGTLDFYLPSEGAISQYIDMVMAHANYWSDPAFGAFVLAEIFAEREDRVRTGVGVDKPQRGRTLSK